MATLHRGKIATDPEILEVRPLTRDDLVVLRDKRAPQGVVKTFRDSHHKIARLVASGLRNEQVIVHAGISITRLMTLKDDPAFIELVSQYRERVTQSFVEEVSDFYEVATSNMLKAEVMLADKLDDAIISGEFLPTKDLLAISRDAADRFGHPKQKVTQNTNFNVDFASMLEKAAARSGRSNVIDAVPMRTVSGPRNLTPPELSSAQPKPPADVAGIRRRA